MHVASYNACCNWVDLFRSVQFRSVYVLWTRLKLTTLATVDVALCHSEAGISAWFRVWDKVTGGSTLIFGDTRNTCLYKASAQTSLIHSVVSIGNESKVYRYNWNNAASPGWTFPMLKYKYIFQIKYKEAILLNSTRKLLWFELAKCWLQFKKNLLCYLI